MGLWLALPARCKQIGPNDRQQTKIPAVASQAQTTPEHTLRAVKHSANPFPVQGPSRYVRSRPENTALGLTAKPPRRTHRRSYDVPTEPPFDGASAGVGRRGPRSTVQGEDILRDGEDGSTAAGNMSPNWALPNILARDIPCRCIPCRLLLCTVCAFVPC